MNKCAPKTCSGCAACYNICPKQCITMKADNEGFLYPFIDELKCVDCRLCKNVCPVLNEYKGNSVGKAYACINLNEEERLESSSGGIFTLLAKSIIDMGGVVFGAAFDEDFGVKHITVSNIEEIKKLQGSKYLQSRIGDTYKQAEVFLKSGKPVLFTGTPCQINGLVSFLRRHYENLFLQDIICHGVPSPLVWKKFLKSVEYKYGCLNKNVFPEFRRKDYGWKRFSLVFTCENNEYVEPLDSNLYMKVFLSNWCLRPSCYKCHSKSLERQSDITLADFWGIEHVLPEMDDNKGTSLVLINTAKGSELLRRISEFMLCKEVNLEQAVRYNTSAYESVKKPFRRKVFMNKMKKVNKQNQFELLIDGLSGKKIKLLLKRIKKS